MSTIREALAEAKARLRQEQVEEPDLSAEILLAHCLQVDRVHLFKENQQPLSPGQQAAFQALLERRGKHCPVAYLTGEQEFFGLRFEVNPSVLIPRPETEFLVEKALDLLKEVGGHPWVVDLGAGSGCIAVALAKRDPRVQVLAVDLSEKALGVARKNARLHRVESQIRFLQGDFLAGVAERGFADLVLSNPPYIDPSEEKDLPPSVKNYEPTRALFTPPGDPTFYHRRIALEASSRLKSGGYLLLELGAGQAERLPGEIRSRGYDPIRLLRDYSGVERVLVAQAF